MRILIVAKTRRGGGACVGGITREGRSVRLMAGDAATNERAGLEYNVGEIWEIEFTPDPNIIPPHVENVIVRSAGRLNRAENIEASILRIMPPVSGGPEKLFDGRLQFTAAGALYVAQRSGLPARSTMFWRPDKALRMNVEGKRIRYCYPTADGGRTLTFVGFQEPVETIPAGTLLRVSLAHWWRPDDKPEDELRCYAQLSGWFLSEFVESTEESAGHTTRQHPSPRSADSAGRGSERFCGASHGLVSKHAPAGGERSPIKAGCDLGRARRVLREAFGFSDFLPLQQEIVTHILEGRDTLGVMPTGGGKSLCYQLPALLFEGLTVVISPLIALMQDQVSRLERRALPAVFLNSTLSHHDYVAAAARVRCGEVRILYVAPETLLRPETLVLLDQSRLACLAVDEAHCISQWGHDFRPEYRQIEEVRRRFPRAVCLALTATATPRVRADIRRLLGIGTTGEFVAGFDRPNLFLAAQPRRDGLGQTLSFLDHHGGEAGIIYCTARKQTDALAAELSARGRTALPYHAGLDQTVRRRNQEQFVREPTLMVATVAFGMGIDQPNVRFILHYNLPRDLECYYQEIGRAGRDGQPADCLLLYSRADMVALGRFIDEGAESERAGRRARLDGMIGYAETGACRRVSLLGYFGEAHRGRCGQCDNCTGRPATTSASHDASGAGPVRWLTAPRRFEEVGQAFAAGESLERLAARFGVKRATILQNLQRYFAAGEAVDPDRLLAASALSQFQQQRVFSLFARLGEERLAPVREALGGAVAYEELHLLRLVFQVRMGGSGGG